MKNYATVKRALWDLLACFISEHNFSHKYVLIIHEINWVLNVD